MFRHLGGWRRAGTLSPSAASGWRPGRETWHCLAPCLDRRHSALSRPIAADPGASWNYCGGLTQLLAAVVQRSTGQPFRDWVEESTRWHLAVRYPVSAFGTAGYGYQWWHNRLQTGWGTIAAPTAIGNGQQRIYVVPDDRLVVTILAGRYDDMTAYGLPTRLLVEYVISAARALA